MHIYNSNLFHHFHFQLKKVVLIRSYSDIFGVIKHQTLEAIDGLFIISFWWRRNLVYYSRLSSTP